MGYVVEGEVVAEVLLGEVIECGVVGLELLNALLGGVEVQVCRGHDRDDDEDTSKKLEETHVEIL
jgi:hypothetical protein